jgi:SAM-dependent methyltransferase
LIKPQIYTEELAVFPIDKNTLWKEVWTVLEEGHFVIIEDYYSTGLQLMNDLKKQFRQLEQKDFKQSRNARAAFREVSHRVLLEVDDHRLLVRKAPEIPWLEKLYREEEYFAISFPDVQALNSSWQWYSKGLNIPGLSHLIHPWYGVYFPTRFEHIELFNEFLQQLAEPVKSAYDIGCGSGILSFLMKQRGIEKIMGTDLNPNAILSMNEDIKRNNYNMIEVRQGDLFADFIDEADMVVFNPPWLPEKQKNASIDQAVYYSEDLFPRFFQEAENKLNPHGKLVLLFSNLVKLTHPDDAHPIEEELEKNTRFKLNRLLQRKVASGSRKTNRNTSRRVNEKVELWILEKAK